MIQIDWEKEKLFREKMLKISSDESKTRQERQKALHDAVRMIQRGIVDGHPEDCRKKNT